MWKKCYIVEVGNYRGKSKYLGVIKLLRTSSHYSKPKKLSNEPATYGRQHFQCELYVYD